MTSEREKEAVMAMEVEERSQLVEELLARIGQTVGQRAQTSAVFGEPVERGGVTVIPVAKARFGFGGGGGSGSHKGEEGSGGGGGGGASVSPIGYIELRDGAAEFRRISTPMDVFAIAVAIGVAALTVKRLLD
jgi:uncharacterized spore protein YtfJ